VQAIRITPVVPICSFISFVGVCALTEGASKRRGNEGTAVGVSYPVALLAVLLSAGDLVVDDPEELGVDSGSGGARRRSREGRKKSRAPSTAGMRTPDPAGPGREEGP
jgi:hypothetical protein